jgi:hypothetical protein
VLQDPQAGEEEGEDPRFRDALAILAMFGGKNPNLRRNHRPQTSGRRGRHIFVFKESVMFACATQPKLFRSWIKREQWLLDNPDRGTLFPSDATLSRQLKAFRRAMRARGSP